MQRWKLVPIEPTAEMLSAAGMGWVIRPSELKKRVRIYKAMVDAAPEPAPDKETYSDEKDVAPAE
jgi:hypothetical protein